MVFQHNYRWDLDKIISPNEGPSAMREYITVSSMVAIGEEMK